MEADGLLPVGAVFEPFLGGKAFTVDRDVSGDEASYLGFVALVEMLPCSWFSEHFLWLYVSKVR